MRLEVADVGPADAVGLAGTLIRTFGPRARLLAEERAASTIDNADVAARWRAVAKTVAVLMQASVHMELALDLLDSVGETNAAPRLDHAIVTLGLRSLGAGPGDEEAIGHGLRAYCQSRAEQHLQVAGAEADLALKSAHLDMAARYAALRERSVEHDPRTPAVRQGLSPIAPRATAGPANRETADQRRDALLQLGDMLHDQEEAAAMIHRTVEIVGTALGVDRACYGEVNHDRRNVSIDASWSQPGMPAIEGEHPLGSCGPIPLAGELLVIDDVLTDERTRDERARWTALSARAVVNAPVRERGRVIAILMVHDRDARQWDENELAFLRSAADRLAMAIGRRQA